MVNGVMKDDKRHPQIKARIALIEVTTSAKLIVIMGNLEWKLLDLQTPLDPAETRTLRRLGKTLARCVEGFEALQAKRDTPEPKPKPKRSRLKRQQTTSKLGMPAFPNVDNRS